jgi:hypothetical protein
MMAADDEPRENGHVYYARREERRAYYRSEEGGSMGMREDGLKSR